MTHVCTAPQHIPCCPALPPLAPRRTCRTGDHAPGRCIAKCPRTASILCNLRTNLVTYDDNDVHNVRPDHVLSCPIRRHDVRCDAQTAGSSANLRLHHAGCRRTPGRSGKAQQQTTEWGRRQQSAVHRAIFAAAASNATPPNEDPNSASSADASASQPSEDADAARERRRSVWERAAQLHAERQVGIVADGKPIQHSVVC